MQSRIDTTSQGTVRHKGGMRRRETIVDEGRRKAVEALLHRLTLKAYSGYNYD